MNSPDDRKTDSAPHSTLMRTGLLNERGAPEQDSMAALSRVYAALFYETLWDSFEDTERLSDFLAPLMEAQRNMEYREAFSLICDAYEELFQPAPEPARMMSGHADLETAFAAGFVRRPAEFCETA